MTWLGWETCCYHALQLKTELRWWPLRTLPPGFFPIKLGIVLLRSILRQGSCYQNTGKLSDSLPSFYLELQTKSTLLLLLWLFTCFPSFFWEGGVNQQLANDGEVITDIGHWSRFKQVAVDYRVTFKVLYASFHASSLMECNLTSSMQVDLIRC